jgi:phage tail sheath gpL-like
MKMSVPASIQTPGFYASFNQNPASSDALYSLLIGQTVTAAEEKPIWIGSISQAIQAFGKSAMLTAEVERYFGTDGASGLLYVLPLADAASSAAATGAIEIGGPATAAGTISLYIGGRLVSVPVSSADTAAVIATAVAAKINAYVDDNGVGLPLTAAVDATDTAKINLTAVNKGTLGNTIDLRINYLGAVQGETLPAGVTVTITAMSSGATDPDLAGIADLLGTTRYEFIGLPWATSTVLNELQTAMAARWAYNEQVYGHVYAVKADADATGATNQTYVQARNNQHETIISYEPGPVVPWEIVSSWLGATAQSSRDDPARPFQTLVLSDLKAPPNSGRYGFSVREGLLKAGAALLDYEIDGTVKILRSVTTYKTNSSGAPDASWHDAETCHLLAAVVSKLKSDFTSQYPRAKLVDDGVMLGAGKSFTSDGAPDQKIVSPKKAKATLIASSKEMETDGWLNGLPDFTVVRDTDDAGRLNVTAKLYLAAGLRVTAVDITFSLGTRA